MEDVVCHAGNQQKINPVDILPEEVWGVLFEKLEPADAFSCYHTSITFRTLLEPKRSTLFFPLVLPILENYLAASLLESIILQCRLVCHTWKRGFDNYSQSLEYSWKHRKDHPSKYHFSTERDIGKFLRFFGNQHSDPFISRTLHLKENTEGEPEDEVRSIPRPFWNASRSLLEQYGSQIWHCSIHIEVDPLLDHLYSFILAQALTLLPNLRMLTIFSPRPFIESGDDLSCANLVVQRSNPVPRLGHLNHLDFGNFPSPIYQSLLDSVDPLKLTRLGIGSHDYLPYFQYSECALTEVVEKGFPNLEHVTFRNISQESSLIAIQSASWPLKYVSLWVTLSLNPAEEGEGVLISDLFETVNKFGETLIELSLTLFGVLDSSESSSLRLCLPRLKYLNIDAEEGMDESLWTCFAEKLEKLESVQWRYHISDDIVA